MDNDNLLFQRNPLLRQPHTIKRGRAMDPLYHLPITFWPDRALLLQEALDVRSEELATYDVNENATIKVHYMGDDTPYLKQMWQGWKDLYGDIGDPTVSYFYIDPHMEYDWHVDTNISHDMTAKGNILCAMNIVTTDENIPAEFMSIGKVAYTAALFNTSRVHRVQTSGKLRVLARITFRSCIYEELVHKVKKINKRILNEQ